MVFELKRFITNKDAEIEGAGDSSSDNEGVGSDPTTTEG